jgi:glycosyltransferase involved in cell wall biosynthesis
VIIRFVHSSQTPHNNYLLGELFREPRVELHRYYIHEPHTVPGRQWAKSSEPVDRTRYGVSRYWNSELLWRALVERDTVFFVIGWEHPILMLIIGIRGLMKSPMLMWDDGQRAEALAEFQKFSVKTLVKKLLVTLINRSMGTFFVTGEKALRDNVEMGVDESKIKKMPFFVLSREPSFIKKQSSSVHIFSGGRMIKDKGFDYFVEVLAALKVRSSNWKATIVGSGEESENVRSLIQHFALNDHVSFLPWAEPEDYNQLMSDCDIFAAPARFDHFPTTVISAMWAKKPVVATNQVGSANEFIRSGENGYITKVGDVSEFCDYLFLLVRDGALRRKMGDMAYATISSWPVSRGVKLIRDAAFDCIQLES